MIARLHDECALERLRQQECSACAGTDIRGQHSKHQTEPCITFLICLVVQSNVEGEQLVVLLVDTAECD